MKHRRPPVAGPATGLAVDRTAADVDVDIEGTVQWDFHGRVPAHSTSRAGAASGGAADDRIVANRYRLTRILGTGGMGAVWLAHDEVLHRSVALKQLTNDQREEGSSALREARAAARITHPGVVQVHDVLIGGDGDWIVMEALPGMPLSQVLRERGQRPLDEVVDMGLQLLSALQAIHDAGLIHRDIKPSNVQVCETDRVVLTDFGLSSPRGQTGGLRTGAVTGSLPYLAPETIIDGRFGPPSDLYALGVTLYVAIEGRQPFDMLTPLDVLDSMLSGDSASPAHAGPLGVVLDGLLLADPARRMDAASAALHLRAIAPGISTSDEPVLVSAHVTSSASMAEC
jgi:serine/threonine protein kinase